ncbi:hypothetical protein EM6_2008 [Asticcacaulis excentricus]|uniref:Uncharacterized protein n=1 Tax=Asticcacaulis excentricus TaxID=78587 RepID=A0A3G9G281_9CAUL|nr:hypothetical protein EM6_2008 [Asticcacaulis excentricus]
MRNTRKGCHTEKLPAQRILVGHWGSSFGVPLRQRRGRDLQIGGSWTPAQRRPAAAGALR